MIIVCPYEIMRWTHRIAKRYDRIRIGASLVRVGLAVAFLAAIATPAAAQMMRGGWEPSFGHLARSAAHWIGILGGLAIVYFADDVRRKTKGSTVASSSLLVEVGTAMFVLVFLDMEVGHLVGAGLWTGSSSMGVTRLWWMAALAAMIALYTLSYRTLVTEIGGG